MVARTAAGCMQTDSATSQKLVDIGVDTQTSLNCATKCDSKPNAENCPQRTASVSSPEHSAIHRHHRNSTLRLVQVDFDTQHCRQC